MSEEAKAELRATYLMKTEQLEVLDNKAYVALVQECDDATLNDYVRQVRKVGRQAEKLDAKSSPKKGAKSPKAKKGKKGGAGARMLAGATKSLVAELATETIVPELYFSASTFLVDSLGALSSVLPEDAVVDLL